MDLNTYKSEVKRTLPKLANKQLDIHHMLFGLQTETAELTDIFKKHLAYNKEIDWINVKEELGDILWYTINLCNILIQKH